jgi:hypothetical protein
MPQPHDAYGDLVEKIQATCLAIDILEAERQSPRRDAAVARLRIELGAVMRRLAALHVARVA